MSKPPAFQFYAADFKMDTDAMSAEQVGAYVRLLCHAWVNGAVPADPTERARIAGVSRRKLDGMWPALERYWETNGTADRLVNPRMEREREKQQRWREKSAKGGRASAAARGDQT